MKDWRTMPLEERKKALSEGSQFSRKEKADACLRRTLAILEDKPFAVARAWKIAWGCYLVNTPEEIAAYCIEQAGTC